MKRPNSRLLNDESRKEFGVLLLLDHLMRYDLLLNEKNDVQITIDKLEEIVSELKKGFFHSEEQDQEINFQKEELREAKDALSQIEKEMEENEKFRINIALVEKDEEVIEPLLKFMEERSILTVGEDNFYQPTKKGRELYCQLVEQLETYIIHFDVFAYVDLEKGEFGDAKEDLLEGNQWSDLRVAVAEFKEINPFRVVFLAMLSEEKFYENTDWKFDLGLGTLFDEFEQIVKDQLGIDDLSYEDQDGIVSGEDVIMDVIEQGKFLVNERRKRKIETEKNIQIEKIPDEQLIMKDYYW